MSLSGQPELTIIVPVHNEAGALADFDRELRAALAEGAVEADVLYVDDGSTDGSDRVLAALGVKTLTIGANRGYGAAIKMGIRATKGEWVAIIDADATYDARDLVRLWALRDRCDMAVGQRPPEVGLRRIAKGLLHAIGSYAVDFRIPDINSGLRIFRRGLALELFRILPNGFSLTSTITLGALYVPYRVSYLPVAYRKRVGHSKIKPMRALNNFTLLILRTMVLWAPLKFFMPPSVVFGAVGLAFLVRDIVAADIAQTSILMLVNAFILFSLGLLAEAVRTRD
jgi:glycosyltransferase involved in cell wall biosynthesis